MVNLIDIGILLGVGALIYSSWLKPKRIVDDMLDEKSWQKIGEAVWHEEYDGKKGVFEIPANSGVVRILLPRIMPKVSKIIVTCKGKIADWPKSKIQMWFRFGSTAERQSYPFQEFELLEEQWASYGITEFLNDQGWHEQAPRFNVSGIDIYCSNGQPLLIDKVELYAEVT